MKVNLSILSSLSDDEIFQKLSFPESGIEDISTTGFDHRHPRHSDLLTVVSVTASLVSLAKFSHWIYQFFRDHPSNQQTSPKPSVTIIINGVRIEISSGSEVEIRAKLEEASRD